VLLLGRRLPARALPWTLVGWTAAMLPAVLAGRPVTDLPHLYTDQVGLFNALTLNAPNLYQWVLEPPLGATGALLLAAVVLGGLVLWLVRAGIASDDELVVRAAVLLLLVAPFTLPHMHERYTFAADALGVAYACVVHRGWMVALAGSTISAIAYLPFGLGVWMPLSRLTGPELALILLVARGLVGAIDRRRTAADPVPEPAST
jgi:Gpi18-like mannosyltransferase